MRVFFYGISLLKIDFFSNCMDKICYGCRTNYLATISHPIRRMVLYIVYGLSATDWGEGLNSTEIIQKSISRMEADKRRKY